jgi:rod shape-determining protein MreD
MNGGGPSACTISVSEDGTVVLVEGSTDIGGTRTSSAMQAAEILGIAAEDVRPLVADTDSIGYTGVTGGLVFDAWRGQALGLFALGIGLTGYLLGIMERRLFKDNFFVPLAAGFTGTLIFQAVFLLVGSFLGLRFALWPALNRVVLPEALYNAVLAPLVFRLTANLLGGGQSLVAGKDNV